MSIVGTPPIPLLVKNNILGKIKVPKNTSDIPRGLVAAYSLRRLYNSYTGPQIRVDFSTNESDNYDIYFDKFMMPYKADNLIEGVTIFFSSQGSFTGWINGRTPYVMGLFDQSGNNKNAAGTGFNNNNLMRPTLLLGTVPYSIYLNGKSTTEGGLFNMGPTQWDVAEKGFTSFTHFNLLAVDTLEAIYDFGNGDTNLANNIAMIRRNNNPYIIYEVVNDTNMLPKNGAHYSHNQWAYWVYSFKPITSTVTDYTIRINNGEVSFRSLNHNAIIDRSTTQTWIGRRNPLNLKYSNMEFTEMVFFNRAVTDATTPDSEARRKPCALPHAWLLVWLLSNLHLRASAEGGPTASALSGSTRENLTHVCIQKKMIFSGRNWGCPAHPYGRQPLR